MKILASLGAVALMTMATAAAAQVKWDLPAGYPPTNFHSKNLEAFANDVRAATAGKLDIKVHAGASLFKVPEIKKAVQTGQAQIGELLMSNLENDNPLFGADTVPFLATSFDASVKLWKAQRPYIEKLMAAQGMTVLYAVPWPSQGIYAKKELNTLEDMKGIKFRSYNPATARIAELVGAQPVTIQAADLAQALATGVVTSFISSGSTGRDSKAWESLSHFHDTQAWLPKNLIFVNNDAYNKLDAATKKALMDAAAVAETRGLGLAKEETESAKAALAAGGMKVLQPSAPLMDGFKKIGDTLTNEWVAKAGPDGKAMVEAYKKM